MQQILIDVLAESILENPFLATYDVEATNRLRDRSNDGTIEERGHLDVRFASDHENNPPITGADTTQFGQSVGHVDAVLNDGQEAILSELAI
jgi:hypothetical protein